MRMIQFFINKIYYLQFVIIIFFYFAEQQWAFYTDWSYGKKCAILDGQKVGHRQQRKVKIDRLQFLCVRIYCILLPSSMVDFVDCDQLVQKAHFQFASILNFIKYNT